MKNSFRLVKAALAIAGMLLFSGAFAQTRTLNTLAESGYRGYVDGTFGVGRLDGPAYMYHEWVLDLSTTHGYQINKNLFAGAGVDFTWVNQDKESFVPVYAAFRYRIPGIETSPFAEARVGLIALNSEWKDPKPQKIYLAGTLGAEITNRIAVIGRLTYSQTPFGDMIFHATVGLEVMLGE